MTATRERELLAECYGHEPGPVQVQITRYERPDRQLQIPAPKKSDFGRDHIEVIEETGPSMLVEDMVLVSGEVARRTEFEKGFPIHFAERGV